MKILIMGLPGSGKTTLAKLLVPALNAVWLNADKVREEANDWDFTEQGLMRQAERMRLLQAKAIFENRVVVADFICPTTLLEKNLMLTTQYGWTQSKKEDLKIQTNCLNHLIT